MSDQSVMLISMPWASLYRPSIQLGTLQSVLNLAGIRTEVRSFNLAFMDFITSRVASQPDEKPFVVDDYFEVAGSYGVGLGDWIFAVAPFRDSGDWEEQGANPPPCW